MVALTAGYCCHTLVQLLGNSNIPYSWRNRHTQTHRHTHTHTRTRLVSHTIYSIPLPNIYVYIYIYIYIYMRVGLPKLSGNLTTKKFLIVTLVSTVSLEVVPLGMYTAIPACFPWFHASLEVLKCECVDNLLRFCVGLLSRVKTTPFQP
jgi:hypothetical protein